MSGILDKKSRILDAILTVDGRRQMAEGTFEVSYVTFTDTGVSYVPDSVNGHEDPTDKLYLEACDLPQDQITFEANDAGKLLSFRKQDITVNYDFFPPPKDGVPPSIVTGKLVNGQLVVYQYRNGRSVKTFDIDRVSTDKDCGFNYSDITGLTGSVLIDPNRSSGAIDFTSSAPWKAKIGTQSGLTSESFATAISGSIEGLRSRGGPSVSCYSVGSIAYLDNNDITLPNLVLEFTGSADGSFRKSLGLRQMAAGGTLMVDEVANASFASQITGTLASSLDNFVNLQTISTINRLFEDDQFELSNNELNFSLQNSLTADLVADSYSPPTVNSIQSLFNDNKVSHLDNFLYLPPIVKASSSEIPDKSKLENLSGFLLGGPGAYPSWGDNEKKLTYEKLKTELSVYKDVKPPIIFTKTSRNNRIIGQFFEVTSDQVNKLDVVDFGDVMDDAQEPTAVTKRVFFVGKTYIDDRGTVCFVNMFTLVFSRVSSNPEEEESR